MKHNCEEAEDTITRLLHKIVEYLARIEELEGDLREARNALKISEEMGIRHGVEVGAR
jgi:hypothetical protein